MTASFTSLPKVVVFVCGRESVAFRLRGEKPEIIGADGQDKGEGTDAGTDTGVVKRGSVLPIHQRCQLALQNVTRIWSSAALAGTWSVLRPQLGLHIPLTWYARQRFRAPLAVIGTVIGGMAAAQSARSTRIEHPGIALKRPKRASLYWGLSIRPTGSAGSGGTGLLPPGGERTGVGMPV